MESLNLKESGTMGKLSNFASAKRLDIALAIMGTALLVNTIRDTPFFNEPLSATQVTEFVSEKDSECRRSEIRTLLFLNIPIHSNDRRWLAVKCEKSAATIEQLKAIKPLP